MKVNEFKMWLNNIGYSDEELESIDNNYLSILEDEYLSLLYGSMQSMKERMEGRMEERMVCCVWTEKENGKGDVYIPSCLKNSSNGVNIFKVAKKYRISVIDIFRKCPYCGHNVIINTLKIPEKK